MIKWLWIVLGTLRSVMRTHRELALENLALRQQLSVWKARQPRPRLTELDRSASETASNTIRRWVRRVSAKAVRGAPQTKVSTGRLADYGCWGAWRFRGNVSTYSVVFCAAIRRSSSLTML